jgi:four helix bundle protein
MASSIPSNIAEGAGRGSDPDFCRFLWYSMGSCNEFESDLIVGHDVKLIPVPLFTQLGNDLSDVRKTLTRLIQTVDHKDQIHSRG